MNINTNELREKLKYVRDGELAPTVEGVQALKDVVAAVPGLLRELRYYCNKREAAVREICGQCPEFMRLCRENDDFDDDNDDDYYDED